MHTVSRLIDSFAPTNYQLSLTLERQKRRFFGIVTIHGSSKVPGRISLHAKELTITSATIDGKAANFEMTDINELTLRQSLLKPGKHNIVVQFEGTITDPMHGLYPCYYTHKNMKKELLATQFESHHAREVFPCIDEPEAKATFDLTLTTEEGVTVLSNMPALSQRHENKQLITTFATTPKMSTYLLAWVVGELHKKTARTKSGIEVNVWATMAQPVSSLDFALDTAIRCTEFFEAYFKTPYPLPNCDHVALPDFSAAAMENWGLITYREAALLVAPQATSLGTKQRIFEVIAHELSHQWFGNLVTMRWWNNLWLNESFATLMSYIAAEALQPSWDTWLEFTAIRTISALRRDSLDGVQAVQTPVSHPDEIGTLFDVAIVYAKGARLLRMLQASIGDAAFQKGLQAYFAGHAFGNTEETDLWQALSTSSNQDISALMTPWISRPGFPVVSITETPEGYTLTQSQFFIGKHAPSDRIWLIPLGATSPLLPPVMRETSLATAADPTLRLNKNDSAHFITHLPPSLFKKQLADLRSGKLPALNRLQFVNEQALLARAGIISSAQLLPLIMALEDETMEPVWSAAGLSISDLKRFVDDDDAAFRQLQHLVRHAVSKQYKRLGWTFSSQDSEADARLRTTIISLMLFSEAPETIKTALSFFDPTTYTQLHPELRPLIMSAAIRYGTDRTLFDSFIKQYAEVNQPQLKKDLLTSLTSTKHPVEIARLLELIMDESSVRRQDVIQWFTLLLHKRDSRDATWNWLREHWPWIVEAFGGDKTYDRFPRAVGSSLFTQQQLNEYRNFFSPMLQEPALARTIRLGINDIEARVESLARDKAAVHKGLAEFN